MKNNNVNNNLLINNNNNNSNNINNSNNSIILRNNDKISRLIALPLLKTEYKDGNIPDLSIDNIINIQKMINTRPKIDLARFTKGKEYFIDYSKNIYDYLNTTNISKELKLLDLKNYNINNNTNTTQIPLLKDLNTTISNIIYEETDNDLINNNNNNNKINNNNNNNNNYFNNNQTNKMKKFNYSIPSYIGRSPGQYNIERREIIFRTYNFIKTISLYNSELGKNNYNVYSFNKKNNLLILDNIYYNLKSWFNKMSSIIGKPVLLFSHNKIKILVCFYWTPYNEETKLESKFYSKFLIYNKNLLEKLTVSLTKYFKKPVELELIRIYAPYMDGNILVNLFGLMSNIVKYGRFRNFIYHMGYIIRDTKLKIRKKEMDPIVPSVLTGIKLRFAGRFMTQKFFRRVRNKEIQRGALTRNTTKLVKLSRFSNKNRRGAYSISITAGYSILD